MYKGRYFLFLLSRRQLNDFSNSIFRGETKEDSHMRGFLSFSAGQQKKVFGGSQPFKALSQQTQNNEREPKS